MAVINRDDGRWLCRYRDENGKTRECSFGRGEEAQIQAEIYDQQWKDYHAAMREQQLRQKILNDPNAITFGKLVKEYLDHIIANERSANHITSIRTVSNAILIPKIGEFTNIAAIDYKDHILPLIVELKTMPSQHGKQLSPITVNKYCNFLKTFFNYAVKRGYLVRNPMALWEPVHVEKQERLLTKEDIVKIMANAVPHIRWAIEVAYELGVRTGESELLSLKWTNVDYENRLVHVYGRKTKTPRVVHIKDTFCDRLQEEWALSESEYIISYNGKQVKSLRRGFTHACEKAGITYPVRMYDIRHRHASELLNANAPIGAVSVALGHSRKSTTLNTYYESLPKERSELPNYLPALPLAAQGLEPVTPILT